MTQQPLDHRPLFSARVVKQRIANEPLPIEHAEILQRWAATIRSGDIRKQKETAIRPDFIAKILKQVLGYTSFSDSPGAYTVTHEKRVAGGAVDCALGRFASDTGTVLVPMELKGADTPSLDAIMPGRHKSPVQQAWEYAMDVPGCQFLLLSNMLEIRLYAVGATRQVYERFDLLDIADSAAAYHRFRLLLGAENLLSGTTAALLTESANAEREITAQLYADYKRWRAQLILSLSQSNNAEPAAFISAAQKLLDRVLFIAFAEDRGLLPANTIASVAKASVESFAETSVWQQFQALFRAIDSGLPRKNIPPYNGGLFAFDQAVDTLHVSDAACAIFAEFGKYDYAQEVSVAVLGHIFEQSIEDLERFNDLAEANAFSATALADELAASKRMGVSGKRKVDGIVYTPEFVTEFLVEHSLGRTILERRNTVLAAFMVDGASPDDIQWRFRAASKREIADYKSRVKESTRTAEFLFWHAWRDALKRVKVCDPACGSGAFLIAAFDLLDAEYKRINEAIQSLSLGGFEMFDTDREILQGNLYGVDLNEESIEITKLSLWLKTAKHGKALFSLDANFHVGNSLISTVDETIDFSGQRLNWHGVYPEIFASSGFDVILGNPPYVRMERIKPIKPYLEKHYAVASDRADLYCYFFELGVRLLRPGGRLAYISSSSFFKTGSGEPLRKFLAEQCAIETVVDFGDLQIFDGVTTYPTTITLRKIAAATVAEATTATALDSTKPDPHIEFLTLRDQLPANLRTEFAIHRARMPQSRLSSVAWQFENDAPAALRKKLAAGRKTFKEVYGAPLYGIKTGLNEAFVIDRATRDRLIREDAKSAELLKPFLEGKDLQKWRIESQDLWIIYIPKASIDIADYPAIRAHLLPFKIPLEKRATKQAWFELQQAQAAYVESIGAQKIVYTRFMKSATFAWDVDSYFVNNALNFAANMSLAELALLNSRLAWFFLRDTGTSMRGGFVQIHGHVLERLPIPELSDAARAALTAAAKRCHDAARKRRDLMLNFAHEVRRDLAPGGLSAKLPQVLQTWNTLDFNAFRNAVKKHFKQDIALDDRSAWETKLTKSRAAIDSLDGILAASEIEIDRLVYGLFNLDATEIALIERMA